MVEIVAFVAVLWAVFQLGRLWEYDREEIRFYPDPDFEKIEVRRGPWDWEKEDDF